MTFGRAIRSEWLLDPDAVYLNHGTVGVVPTVVLDAQTAIRLEIEAHPSERLLREVTPLSGAPREGRPGGRIRGAAASAAALYRALPDDVAFVDNATTGVNAVLQSLELGADDVVVITETTYGGVREAVRYACRRSGAGLVVARLPCPVESPEQVVDAVAEALPSRPTLAIIDHIESETGVVLPLVELVELCHERGALALVDAAHAPGQLELDVPSYGADAYVGNLHKWAMAPRSCALLWVAPQLQSRIHPTVVSWNLDRGFVAEFDWIGTRDPSGCLAVPAALDFIDRLDFAKMQDYNHDLLWRGVALLTERWGTAAVAPKAMSAFMIAVEMPARFAATKETGDRLRDQLLFEHRIEVPVFALAGRLWTRLSVQVYNELEDFERLAAAVEQL
ncbi:MAG: aminotransferase class V-fold PLP-dependent enzyme [Acidobacteriota bacterium]|nr:aminotransferase class V-fold PLP-dependent enzyme [Acidobacteriota bacterium]